MSFELTNIYNPFSGEQVDDNQTLLSNKAPSKQKRSTPLLSRSKIITAAAVVVLLATWCSYTPSTTPLTFPIPAFSRLVNAPKRAIVADAMIFKANAIAKLAGGAEETSTFSNVVTTWAKYLEHDRKKMSETNHKCALVILNFMKKYLAVKETSGPEKQMFFAKAFALLNFRNGESFVKGHHAATGHQLRYWKFVQANLKEFNQPKWIDKHGKPLKQHLVHKLKADTKTGYWKGAWGPEPVQDTNGNSLYTKHNIAAQMFNHNLKNLPFNFNRAMTSKFIPLRYLQLFESSRLGNKIDADDQQMTHAVERLIKSWSRYLDTNRINKVKKAFNL